MGGGWRLLLCISAVDSGGEGTDRRALLRQWHGRGRHRVKNWSVAGFFEPLQGHSPHSSKNVERWAWAHGTRSSTWRPTSVQWWDGHRTPRRTRDFFGSDNEVALLGRLTKKLAQPDEAWITMCPLHVPPVALPPPIKILDDHSQLCRGAHQNGIKGKQSDPPGGSLSIEIMCHPKCLRFVFMAHFAWASSTSPALSLMLQRLSQMRRT